MLHAHYIKVSQKLPANKSAQYASICKWLQTAGFFDEKRQLIMESKVNDK